MSFFKKILCCDFYSTNETNKTYETIPSYDNEIEQSMAASISDRATDEVIDALTRYRRGLGISDSPSVLLDEPQTPDIVRSRSSHDADGFASRSRGLNLPKLGLDSPTATPHLPSKRRSIARKVRPQSVVENLSLGHIPDLLESPSSHRSSNASPRVGDSSTIMNNDRDDECCDSITELPSASFQLQHLVKGRPKRAKTRAPTRPHLAEVATREIGEGLEHFFRPGSVTPTTLTPLVSPTSEECSSLSFVDSPTMSRDENGKFQHLTSEETTPILEERRPIKLDRSSPLLKGVAWTTRSRSSDNLEKYSPLIGRKSPLVKMKTEGQHDDRLSVPTSNSDDKVRSPSNDSIKNHMNTDCVIVKTGNGIVRTPIVLQKPRPWSVVGNEPKSGDYHNDSCKTTPEKLDEDCDVVPFGQSGGGSIVGISPGTALSSGGSIVGITPGACLEKKSVREMAAGLNRMDIPKKPQVMPRTKISNSSSTIAHRNSISEALISNISSSSLSSSIISSSLSNNSNTINETRATSLNTNSSKTITSSTTTTSSMIISETSINNGNKRESELNIKNSNGDNISNNNDDDVSDSPVILGGTVKTIAGKKISSIFEETLVEGLQKAAFRRTMIRDSMQTQYVNDDAVDV